MNFRSMASQLFNRTRFRKKPGVTFNGNRDLYEALGYPTELCAEDYRAEYERNGVAARIVEAYPKDTWRGGAELIEDEDLDTVTEFEQAFFDLDQRLNIWDVFERADILAGLGQYAIVVIGAPGKLDEPLTHASPDDIAYLTPYSEEDAPVKEIETDEANPRFGRPTTYEIRRTVTTMKTYSAAALIGKRVHYTRVLHIIDGLLDDEINGTPRLKRVWNRLIDLEKVTGGGAEAYWKRADGGLQLDLDPTLELDDDAETELREQVDDYVHGLKRVMTTRGLKINRLGSDVAGFKDPASAIFDQISAATGIPQRILMGSERGQLASSQDRTNWDERVAARRTGWAEVRVVRPFVLQLIALGALPQPKQYDVRWSPTQTLDDMQRAELADKYANINQKAGQEVVTLNEIRTRALGFPRIEEVSEEPRQPKQDPTAASAKKGEVVWKHVHRAADRFRPKGKAYRQASVQRGA